MFVNVLGRGNCVITAVCDGVTYKCCLNNVDRVSSFWKILEQFADNLRCCPNLFGSAEIHTACTLCGRQSGSAFGNPDPSTRFVRHKRPASVSSSVSTSLSTECSSKTSSPCPSSRSPDTSQREPPDKKARETNASKIILLL